MVKSDYSKWIIPDLPASITFPTLPPIDDKHLRDLTLTHTSKIARPHSPSLEAEEGITDYEKLEHIGDAIFCRLLADFMSRFLHEHWPNLKHGPASKLKSELCSDKVLTQISDRYNLISRLIAHVSTLPAIRHSIDVKATLFESYIAGLYYSYLSPIEDDHHITTEGQAIEEVGVWLKGVFGPIASLAYESIENRQNPDLIPHDSTPEDASRLHDAQLEVKAGGCRALLNQYLVKYGFPVVQEPTPAVQVGDNWKVTLVASTPMGEMVVSPRLVCSNKKDAKAVAAYKIYEKLGLAV